MKSEKGKREERERGFGRSEQRNTNEDENNTNFFVVPASYGNPFVIVENNKFSFGVFTIKFILHPLK